MSMPPYYSGPNLLYNDMGNNLNSILTSQCWFKSVWQENIQTIKGEHTVGQFSIRWQTKSWIQHRGLLKHKFYHALLFFKYRYICFLLNIFAGRIKSANSTKTNTPERVRFPKRWPWPTHTTLSTKWVTIFHRMWTMGNTNTWQIIWLKWLLFHNMKVLFRLHLHSLLIKCSYISG